MRTGGERATLILSKRKRDGDRGKRTVKEVGKEDDSFSVFMNMSKASGLVWEPQGASSLFNPVQTVAPACGLKEGNRPH